MAPGTRAYLGLGGVGGLLKVAGELSKYKVCLEHR
jgi:hypothetical protein